MTTIETIAVVLNDENCLFAIGICAVYISLIPRLLEMMRTTHLTNY